MSHVTAWLTHLLHIGCIHRMDQAQAEPTFDISRCKLEQILVQLELDPFCEYQARIQSQPIKNATFTCIVFLDMV